MKELFWMIPCFICICIICIAHHVFQKKTFQFVQKNSIYLAKLAELNTRYTFNTDINSSYSYTHHCKTKPAFDRADLNQIFLNYISENLRNIQLVIPYIQQNRTIFSQYRNEIQEIFEQNPPVSPKKRLQELEINQFKKLELHPILDIGIQIFCEYTSPKGRNHYSKHYMYTLKDILSAIEKIKEIQRKKESREYQRSLMSDSLRYDVLKRDGFRCVLCGASAEDGVQLHVDHILPVSKGGKTELSNLRTLCSRCNFGKSDKYDPYGLN